MVLFINEMNDNDYNNNVVCYATPQNSINELEKLKMQTQFQNTLIEQQRQQIETLTLLVDTLKQQIKHRLVHIF